MEDNGQETKMFHWALQCLFRLLEKFQTSWLAKHCPVLLLRQATSLYISTVYIHTLFNMHAASVCFCNPPNYDMDYRIFNVPTWSFNVCIHTHEFAFIYSVRLNGCLLHGGGLGPLFVIGEGPWAPFYEILEATLQEGTKTVKCWLQGQTSVSKVQLKSGQTRFGLTILMSLTNHSLRDASTHVPRGPTWWTKTEEHFFHEIRMHLVVNIWADE